MAQKTFQKLKTQKTIASLVFWIGVIWVVVQIASIEKGGEQSDVGMILMLVGLVWYVITRYRIWWHQKPNNTPD